MVAVGISQSGSLAPDASKAKSSAASIFSIIDRKSKTDSSDTSGTTIKNINGDIELHHAALSIPRDLMFRYSRCLAIHSGKGNLLELGIEFHFHILHYKSHIKACLPSSNFDCHKLKIEVMKYIVN